ncbi:MAG: CoA transferase [Pyrobaculum sp.]
MRLGFSVAKVEPPDGDPMARLSPTLYKILNSCKDVVYLDLRSEAGRGALYRLASGVKALVTTFRPAALERLGVGYRQISQINPTAV